MKKLRLLITKECNRNCEGCCNKEYDLFKLPICTSFKGYDEIILTGGEIMLFPEKIIDTCGQIYIENPNAKIYAYTAKVDNDWIYDVIGCVDGLTGSFHEQNDVEKFIHFNNIIKTFELDDLSLRLNVVEGIDISMLDEIDLKNWKVKIIKWKKDCPLPKDEIFMRLKEI